MNIFSKLFKRTGISNSTVSVEKLCNRNEIDSEYQPMPAFIQADVRDYELVSIIATAIAAEERPESKFIVKNILQRNTEVQVVSLIATSVAAGIDVNSKFIVRNISKK